MATYSFSSPATDNDSALLFGIYTSATTATTAAVASRSRALPSSVFTELNCLKQIFPVCLSFTLRQSDVVLTAAPFPKAECLKLEESAYRRRPRGANMKNRLTGAVLYVQIRGLGYRSFPKLGKRGEGDSRRFRCESRYEEEKVSALDLLGS